LIDVKEHTADKIMITERPWGHGFKSHPAHHDLGSSPPDFGQPLSLGSAKKPHESYGMSRAKCLHLIEDPEVKRWHQNVARGSRITADV